MSTTTTAPTTFRADRFRDLYETNLPVPPRRLRMWTWFEAARCGTVACVCGHYAAAHPEEFVTSRGGDVIRDTDGREMWYAEWAEHFGITEDEALQLFHPKYDAAADTKKSVMGRLRAFAAERGMILE